MKRFRIQLAMLLVGSIMFVVAIASLVIWLVVDPPKIKRYADIVATQIIAASSLIERIPPAERSDLPAGLTFATAPAEGPVLDRTAEIIGDALVRQGRPMTFRVTQPSAEKFPLASVRLPSQGWLILPVPVEPPPVRGWLILSGWLLIVAAGTTLVSIFLANRLTRPLALLEHAVELIRPDGALPQFPERGPALVQVTARAINLLSSRLRSAMESRMRVVAAAGHDLRTPMTRMRLRAEFISDEEERERWLADLNELDRIADSAIRLVREEVDDAPQEQLRLDEVVLACADELEELGLPVRVSSSTPVEVRAGPLALRRALRNLLTNAATHGMGADVHVRRADREALVWIDDQGPGIPQALMRRVFEPFFRADPARRQGYGGAGLGLAIAKEIIDRNNGALTLSNRPEGGLRQEIRLPLSMT